MGAMGQSVLTVGRDTTGVLVGRGGNGCDSAIVIAQLVWLAKLDPPGLYCAFRALRLHIFGVRNLVVEVMSNLSELNNPDVHPATAFNRWIAAALTARTAARRST